MSVSAQEAEGLMTLTVQILRRTVTTPGELLEVLDGPIWPEPLPLTGHELCICGKPLGHGRHSISNPVYHCECGFESSRRDELETHLKRVKEKFEAEFSLPIRPIKQMRVSSVRQISLTRELLEVVPPRRQQRRSSGPTFEIRMIAKQWKPSHKAMCTSSGSCPGLGQRDHCPPVHPTIYRRLGMMVLYTNYYCEHHPKDIATDGPMTIETIKVGNLMREMGFGLWAYDQEVEG